MTNPGRVGYIDTWRCIAVFGVIISHLNRQEGLQTTAVAGEIGVFLFFFISGFVVSKTCLIESRTSRRFSSSAFYVRRLFRIAPPLLIYISICLALGWVGAIDFGATQALSAAAYICNVDLVDCGWYGGHTWSLAFEEQFYLLFPLIFAWVETSRRPSFFFLVLFSALASLPFLFSLHWIGKTGFAVIYGLFAMGYFFAKHEHRLHKIGNASLLFFLGLALTFLPVGLFGGLWAEKYYKFVYVISIPMMISASGNPFFAAKKLLELRLTRYIGRISYSIYLWQQFFTGYFHDFPMGVRLIVLVGMVLWCACLFAYVETPLIRAGSRLSNSLRSRAPMSPPVADTPTP